MRGLASNSNPSTPAAEVTPRQHQSPHTPAAEPDRPEVEALTPPSFDPESPQTATNTDLEPTLSTNNSGNAMMQAIEEHKVAIPPLNPQPATAGLDLLASLSGSSYGVRNGTGMSKKRKMTNDGDDFPDLGGDAMDGIDDDVAEMLRNDIH